MAVGIAKKVTLTEKQRYILEDLVASRTARVDHVKRAKIILKSANGMSNMSIGKSVLLHRNQVSLWRNRWISYEDSLLRAEEEMDNLIEYKRYIEGLLSDLQRPGGPTKFSAKQLCQIYAAATERPEESGLPLSHWSLSSLAAELAKRGIVNSISTSQLSIFLKSAGT